MSTLGDIAASQAIRTFLAFLSRASVRDVERLLFLAEKAAPDEGAKEQMRSIRRLWREGHPLAQLVQRVLTELNPNCRARLVTNLLVNAGWLGGKRRGSWREKEGLHVPFTYLISPTMRCNLRCAGCYAGQYSLEDDLPPEVIDRVLTEGEELGIYFVTILGGEPFIRKDMWAIYEKHSDIVFQVYTNGWALNDEVVDRLAGLGNVVPAISLEGFEEETDTRRGKGTFQRIMEAMDRLHQAGAPFGFSSMVTRQNLETIISDEFNNMLVAKGCFFGWHFLYMPVGRNPDLSLMPTPQERNRLRTEGAARIRDTKPLFVVDFWNDAPYVDGCIAGGRDYFHINSHGDVEPCIFCHFAVDNIKEKGLREVLRSPLFLAIQSRQPYSPNTLRPCMLIDHPWVFREIYAETSPYPTHPGAESLVTSLCAGLDVYSRGSARVLDPVWQEEYMAKGFGSQREAVSKAGGAA
ncbi:MAG TPA: radical SAM protein [Chloroflexi bacterium]|nr:radical SAM protein [Chloroflexota bacterium]